MSKKNAAVRFAAVTPAGLRSTVWRLWSSGPKGDVYLAARTLAQDIKVSFHHSGKWRHAFTEEHVSKPTSFVPSGEDRAQSKWRRPSEMAPGVTMAFQIIVPASEVTLPAGGTGSPTGSKQSIVRVPAAPIGSATYFTIIFTTRGTTAATLPGWPGRRAMDTVLVGRIGLPTSETVWVVAHEQRLPEPQRATLAQRRVHIARVALNQGFQSREFHALYFGIEDEVGFYTEVSNTGFPLASEKW